jgi:UDP-N-acetylmuramyl pentapeptide phosphotransferase/UDP-N-acetylglucosamine-1-phosphate transferase
MMAEVLLFESLILILYFFVFRFFELGRFNRLRDIDKVNWVPGVMAPFFILCSYFFRESEPVFFHLLLWNVYLFGLLDDTQPLDVYAKFLFLVLLCIGFVVGTSEANFLFIFLLFFYFNAFNFIDGIHGFFTGALLVHLAFIYWLQPDVSLFYTLVASALVFIVNLIRPLKYIPGNAGAYAGGFLLFYFDYHLSESLQWPLPFFFSFFYFADVILTLSKRMIRKEDLLQAHQQHYYQKFAAKGYPHALVSFFYMFLQTLFNLLLMQFI